jgi:hypothetical protein
MFEPANYTSNNKTSVTNNIFLSGHKPTRLNTYNKEFSCGNNSITSDGLPFNCLQCVGTGNGGHLFLSFKGHQTCCICYKSCC